MLAVVLSAVLAADQHGVTARIVGVDAEYANINTDVSAEQLDAHAIVLGSRFTFEYAGNAHFATFVSDYADVAKGEWLGLLGDDNTLKIAISFGQACSAIACEIGDEIIIYPASHENR